MNKKIFVVIALMMCIAVASCSKMSTPDAEQIKSDLIGNQITFGANVWRFSALSEFTEFTIKGKQIEGDTIEYNVTMRLKDLKWGDLYLLDALITYKYVDGKWQLKYIVPTLWTLF